MDTQNNMRNFIGLTEDYVAGNTTPLPDGDDVVEETDTDVTNELLGKLNEAVQSLRSYMEPNDTNPEEAFGVEIGMQRAADLIESIIRDFGGDTRG